MLVGSPGDRGDRCDQSVYFKTKIKIKELGGLCTVESRWILRC